MKENENFMKENGNYVKENGNYTKENGNYEKKWEGMGMGVKKEKDETRETKRTK